MDFFRDTFQCFPNSHETTRKLFFSLAFWIIQPFQLSTSKDKPKKCLRNYFTKSAKTRKESFFFRLLNKVNEQIKVPFQKVYLSRLQETKLLFFLWINRTRTYRTRNETFSRLVLSKSPNSNTRK